MSEVSGDGVQLSPSRATPRLINQLVQSVTGTPATTSTGVSAPDTPSLAKEHVDARAESIDQAAGQAQQAANATAIVIKSVEAGDNTVYVGSNDGRIKICQIDQDVDFEGRQRELAGGGSVLSSLDGLVKSPRASVLKQTQEVAVTHGRKAADRIALLHRLDKAAILSEGILTFHALPTLTPLNVHTFPAVRGCISFSLDEAELAGGGDIDSMHICVVRRRSIQLLKVTNQGISQLKDLPLLGALMAVLRGRHVCTADKDNYSVIDLNEAVALPLLPISQMPNPEFEGSTLIDPKQRPAIACVGSNEFLIASHTGSTTLGVFVTESGEPCRGTLEWASNLRSLACDPQYSIALLHNNTIEVHSLHNQVIAQVVQLPSAPSPSALQPRSLVYSWSGLDLGVATGAYKTDLVSLPLLPPPAPSPSPPSTPKKGSHRHSVSSMSLKTIERGTKGISTRTMIVGRNSLFALTPLTLVAQADALFDKGRVEDALELAQQAQTGPQSFNVEATYVVSRAANHFLSETLFQKAFELFARAGTDPRWVIRMFEDLRGQVIEEGDQAPLLRGLQAEAVVVKTVDELILDNLNRNYSPHIKPDVETAGPTVEIRATLTRTARESLLEYLKLWRKERRRGDGNALVVGEHSSKIDKAADTTLARLYAEQGQGSELVDLLESDNSCEESVADQLLVDVHRYTTFAERLLAKGRKEEALDIWTRLHDGEYTDSTTEEQTGATVSLERLLQELRHSPDKALIEKFGFWLVSNDQDLALRLFTDANVMALFDVRALLDKLRDMNGDVADLVLEHVVLRLRKQDEALHTDLVERYLGKVETLMSDSKCKTVLNFLLSTFDGEGDHAQFDRTRLKLVVFLAHSSKYSRESVKTRLDELEKRGMRGLTLERVIVYGKLQLDRQALSLLVNGLQDFVSAEVYCHQGGDPLIASEKARAGDLCDVFTSPKGNRTTTKKGAASLSTSGASSKRRRAELSKLLIEMSLLGQRESVDDDGQSSLDSAPAIARILEAQATTLDPAHVLPMLPDGWPLSLVAPYLSSTLRRSLHERQETSLLKALAGSQNLAVSEKYGELVLKLEPTRQDKSDGDGPGNNVRSGEKGIVVEMGSSKTREQAEKVISFEEAVELDLR
ncbi:hypothetical protein ACM66B_001842 [Microbotryomycetes sp. NB124-2]